jgi:hypothetical protein
VDLNVGAKTAATLRITRKIGFKQRKISLRETLMLLKKK